MKIWFLQKDQKFCFFTLAQNVTTFELGVKGKLCIIYEKEEYAIHSVELRRYKINGGNSYLRAILMNPIEVSQRYFTPF